MLYVKLPIRTHSALLKAAVREHRGAREQAVVLIERALRWEGILRDPEPDEQRAEVAHA